MMSSGINLVMTVIGFTVSTMFIMFVCTRLICAIIQLNASRRSFARASGSDLSIFRPDTERELKVCDLALYCLNKVEKIISRAEIKRMLGNPKEIAAYRHHIASSIYAHSTEASTIDDIITNMS